MKMDALIAKKNNSLQDILHINNTLAKGSR